MSSRIPKATAGAPMSGQVQRLLSNGQKNKNTRGTDRPAQQSKITRGDTKGPGR